MFSRAMKENFALIQSTTNWKICTKTYRRLFVCFMVFSNLLLVSYIILVLFGFSTTEIFPSRKDSRPIKKLIIEPESHQKIRIINRTPHFANIEFRKTFNVVVPPAENDYPQKRFIVIENYIPATSTSPDYNSSVTLTTQATYDYLEHVQVLCQRWDGPISLAVYAPDTDLEVASRKILFMRQCGPPCVSTNVSWHIIFDESLGPPSSDTRLPRKIAKMELYAPFDCSVGMAAMNLTSDARRIKQLPYPINVARNVARLSATTKFVFSSDIELYPSLNTVSRFIRMVTTSDIHKSNQVYHLPIFEIERNVPFPNTKLQLIELFNKGQVVFFHRYVCDSCHAYPRRNEWMKYIPVNDTLSVFSVTKRERPYHRWEPFYISTNDIPLFDERFTWNGKINKMAQAHKLCRLGYDFLTLDNAFLVHAPGVKTLKMAMDEQKARLPYMSKNNLLYKNFLKEMNTKYGYRKNC